MFHASFSNPWLIFRKSKVSKAKFSEEENVFFSALNDFATAQGIIKKTSIQKFGCLPFTVFPTPIPKLHFENLKNIQPHINDLMYSASQDDEFLTSSLQSVAEVDDFTRNLFRVYEKAKASSTRSLIELGILRSDYMFDCNSIENDCISPKQIEINTISVSYVGIAGNRIKAVHSKALQDANRTEDIKSLPDNPSTNEVAKALVAAWNAYDESSASIVFLVYEFECQTFDQRAVEYEINSINQYIPVRRKTLNNVIKTGNVENNGGLYIDNEEVAVVYYRCGYKPNDYPSQKHWDARLTIEKSKAIKCPSVALQLVGCKKFQEVLARPGSVERLIDDKEAAAAIRKTFAGLYTLEMNSDGDKAVKMALERPESYVMKPQREGGGNNYFGREMARLMKKIGKTDKRRSYILMDRVRPKVAQNYISSKGEIVDAEIVNELGIYGVFLAEKGKMTVNHSAGHLLRSKLKDKNEGSIKGGTAALDSPLLV